MSLSNHEDAMPDLLADAMTLLPMEELAAVSVTAEAEAKGLRANDNPADHARAIALETVAASALYALQRELAHSSV
jgi:hypothetical protein